MKYFNKTTERKGWNYCSNDEKIERWEQVLRVMENLSPHEKEKHFNMDSWGYETDCGTVACIGGHCGLDSWFRRRGFKMQTYGTGYPFDFEGMSPEEFFGAAGCYRVFIPSSCLSRKQMKSVPRAIKEIKSYLKDLKAELREAA